MTVSFLSLWVRKTKTYFRIELIVNTVNGFMAYFKTYLT